jgi:hypothetical protein
MQMLEVVADVVAVWAGLSEFEKLLSFHYSAVG